ncbi:MAG: hypothetical protein WBQ61_07240 [Candidatus Acidiferrum sp.]
MTNPDADHPAKHENRAERFIKITKEWIEFTAWPMVRNAVWPAIKSTLTSSTFWTAVATVVIACATCIYTYYSKKQWQAMDGQLTAMKGQLDEMKALHPQPFVAIEGNTLTAQLLFNGGCPTFKISYSVKNYGTAVAINEFDGAVPLYSDNLEKTTKLFKEYCSSAYPGMDTNKLSPDQVEEITHYGVTMIEPGMTIPGMQGSKSPISVNAIPGDHRRIPLFVIEACISYQSEPGGKMHHSGYLYRAAWRIPPVEVTNDGWTYFQINGFHLDRTTAD